MLLINVNYFNSDNVIIFVHFGFFFFFFFFGCAEGYAGS